MEADLVSLLELLIPSASQYNQCSAEPTAGRRKARTALTCSAVSDVLSLLLCRVSMGGERYKAATHHIIDQTVQVDSALLVLPSYFKAFHFRRPQFTSQQSWCKKDTNLPVSVTSWHENYPLE